MTHWQVEQRKLQVKSGVSWALLCVVILTGQSQLTICERKLSLLQVKRLRCVIDLKMIGKGFVLFKINSSPSAFYIIKPTCIVIGF